MNVYNVLIVKKKT